MNAALTRLIFTLVCIGPLSDFSCLAAAETQIGFPTVSIGKTLIHDGLSRNYALHVPASISKQDKVPLVLVLHGGGGNASNAERMTGFSAKADQEGFIVAYPEGTGRRNGRLLTWNAGHCCGYAMTRRIDDTGFIRALIDTLSRDYPVDAKRVYVTGMSNGGMMTHRLGRELSDRIAAIAPVAATVFGDETVPAEPVSAIIFNGQLDTTVPGAGGMPDGLFPAAWDGRPIQPTLDQLAFWSRTDGCSYDPAGNDRGNYVLWQAQCPQGLAAELYLVKNIGHAWPVGERGTPGADQPGNLVRATDLIWSFFKAHPKHR